MKKAGEEVKKLRLSRETLTALESPDTLKVLGGADYSQVVSCPSALGCCIEKTGTN